jgi:hypothetical protein
LIIIIITIIIATVEIIEIRTMRGISPILIRIKSRTVGNLIIESFVEKTLLCQNVHCLVDVFALPSSDCGLAALWDD